MTIQLFVRDVVLPPVPPELVPYLSQLLQAAGHRVRWEPAHGAMLVDSPLDGYRVRCLVAAPHNRMAGLIASGLARWVQLAGATVVQGSERRADLAIVVRAELLSPGGSASVLLGSRPRHWFGHRESLAGAAAAKVRGAVQVPVAVSHRWSLGKNELDVTVAAPEHERLAQVLSKAIWRGLMSYFCKGAAMLDVAMVASFPAPQATPRPAPQPTPAPQPEPEPELTPAPHREPRPAPHAPRVIWSSDAPDPHQLIPLPMPAAHRAQSGTPAVRAASWSGDSRH